MAKTFNRGNGWRIGDGFNARLQNAAEECPANAEFQAWVEAHVSKHGGKRETPTNPSTIRYVTAQEMRIDKKFPWKRHITQDVAAKKT